MTGDGGSPQQPRLLGERVQGYIDAKVGENESFQWGLVDLDRSDLYHLRRAVQRYFRQVAAETVGDAFDISMHVHTVARVGELVAAIEAVEKAQGEANAAQVKWRDAERNRKYREEQAEMRARAAQAVKRDD